MRAGPVASLLASQPAGEADGCCYLLDCPVRIKRPNLGERILQLEVANLRLFIQKFRNIRLKIPNLA
jgi:hypothetical protein